MSSLEKWFLGQLEQLAVKIVSENRISVPVYRKSLTLLSIANHGEVNGKVKASIQEVIDAYLADRGQFDTFIIMGYIN